MQYKIYKNMGFTLAEVLITIGLIGVIAAITIPTLITNVKEIVYKHKIKTVEAKLIKGINLLNADNGVNSYPSTEAFLKDLSKHLKMISICDQAHISDCLTYDNIAIEGSAQKLKAVKIKILPSEESFYQKGYKDVAAFIMGDGTPIIASFKTDCVSDSEIFGNIHPCLIGAYDINGNSTPNTFNSDLHPFNGAQLQQPKSCEDDYLNKVKMSRVDKFVKCQPFGNTGKLMIYGGEDTFEKCKSFCIANNARMMTASDANEYCATDEAMFGWQQGDFNWWNWVDDGNATSSQGSMIRGKCNQHQSHSASANNITCACVAN